MVNLHSYIVKFIMALGLGFSKPQTNHILALVHGMILTDGRKTSNNILRSTDQYRHRSSLSNFYNHSPWSPNRMTRRRIQMMKKRIQQARAKKGDTRPVTFLIIDDTQNIKDLSTSKMEGLDFHFYHPENKSKWSHCVVTAHLVAEEYSFALDFRPYFRESYCADNHLCFKSKNDLAIELIKAYESPTDEQVYVLADSWYTSKSLVEACQIKGFELIAAFKMNRNFYPNDKQTKVSDFVSKGVSKSDLHSVTVNGHAYKVYRYEGQISDIKHVKALLCWEPEKVPQKPSLCVLSTDTDLDFVTIQEYYDVRWNIETGYRYLKDLLGFDQYQMLSEKGIERFWAIQFLTYNVLEVQRIEWSTPDSELTIGDVVRRIRQDHLGQIVMFVYEKAQAQTPVTKVLESLKLTA